MAKYEELGKGIIKRSEVRRLGLFIDGTGLDRATRRINKKVDMSSLLRGVTSGTVPAVARYYTLIPYEDDSRQRAFLDAVTRAGLQVIVKRLPPKGVSRQVSVDIEMAADIVAFALGHMKFSDLSEYKPDLGHGRGSALPSAIPFPRLTGMRAQRADTPTPGTTPGAVVPAAQAAVASAASDETKQRKEKRSVVLVCPSRDLAYAISLVKELGVDTTTADFGQFNTGDILKSAAKWIDLSDSETIWRE